MAEVRDWPDAPLPEDDGIDWVSETRRMIEEGRAARRAKWINAEKASRGGDNVR